MDRRLYEYVRRIVLSEALTQNDMALYVIEQDPQRVGIVYNARNIANLLKLGNKADIAEAFEDKILGGIGIKKPDDPCADAWEVTNSVGKGQGKLVYALGFFLSPTRRLMPDRHSVSQDAFAGWAKQSKRPKKALDNVKKPSDNDDSNDCEVWGTEDSDVVDNSYAGDSSGFDFDAMMQRHKDANDLFQEKGYDLENGIYDAFVNFWERNYKANVRLKKNPDGTVTRTPLLALLFNIADFLPSLSLASAFVSLLEERVNALFELPVSPDEFLTHVTLARSDSLATLRIRELLREQHNRIQRSTTFEASLRECVSRCEYALFANSHRSSAGLLLPSWCDSSLVVDVVIVCVFRIADSPLQSLRDVARDGAPEVFVPREVPLDETDHLIFREKHLRLRSVFEKMRRDFATLLTLETHFTRVVKNAFEHFENEVLLTFLEHPCLHISVIPQCQERCTVNVRLHSTFSKKIILSRVEAATGWGARSDRQWCDPRGRGSNPFDSRMSRRLPTLR
jgi:hypothetical protein